jgi:hypothetical protein
MTHHASFKLLWIALWLLGLGATASEARAQELGREGNLVFGAERLFGLYFDHQSIDTGVLEYERDGTLFGIGWQDPLSALATPRLGVDYFIDEHLTVGGNFGVFTRSVNDDDETGILVAARVGYALRLSSAIAFWPRAGITFATINADGNADSSVVALSLEGMFSIAPSDSWSFMLGPVLDLGFAGEENDADYSEILFGIMIGLAGWFDV